MIVFELAMTLVCEDFENWEKDTEAFVDQLKVLSIPQLNEHYLIGLETIERNRR